MPIRDFARDGLQEGHFVFREIAAFQREEVDHTDDDFGLGAAAQHHRHRNLRGIHIFARCRGGDMPGVGARVGCDDDPSLQRRRGR